MVKGKLEAFCFPFPVGKSIPRDGDIIMVMGRL